jgi:hypothetical protein
LLCHTFLVVIWVVFLVWALFFLLFGCGVMGFSFTSMLFLLVVGVGYVDVAGCGAAIFNVKVWRNA